ncbi:MAG: sugar ABC transporter permease [Candidatus Hydrogenedentes bacterium]|nr:sugar ABC transporter permease [Candidatus Hydrogenedentota bacterium]
MNEWFGLLGIVIASASILALRQPLVAILDSVLERLDSRFERQVWCRQSDTAMAVTLLFPGLGILAVFGFAPLIYALYISLFDTRAGAFAGPGNYVRAWHDPEFWGGIRVTIYYAIGTIPATLLLSFGVAWLLFRIGRGRGFFRTVYFLPYVTSAVAAATVWRVLLRPHSGYVNALMEALGLPTQLWLIEQRGVLHLLTNGWIGPEVGPSLALCCIIAFDIWHASGFGVVIFLAGLTAIPRELEEAAIVDGARPWQVMTRVVLPLLSPTVFFLAIVSAIKAFQAFNSFYALTNTARSTDTQNLVIYIYSQLYESQNYGYGATVAVCLCVAIVGLTLVQWRVLGRWVHYE